MGLVVKGGGQYVSNNSNNEYVNNNTKEYTGPGYADCWAETPESPFCVEPAQLPAEKVMVARALSRTVQAPRTQVAVRRAETNMTSADSQLCQAAYMLLTNFAKKEIVLPKSTAVGMAEEISEALVATINSEYPSRKKRSTKGPRDVKVIPMSTNSN
jgi:hypothetical protein